ncbi:MAG: pseudouridine synthase [Candidatus Heimdallarchaeota archaeon]|nr:pseudouridine synthase [Candidatus Heimdallarchaeota archaeon]
METSNPSQRKIVASLSMQYPGIDFSGFAFDLQRSRKTGRIRSILLNNILLFSLRTHDGRYLPTIDGARFLLQQGFEHNRVYIKDEAVPFVSQGKSAYCKHVVKVDDHIYPELEVFVCSLEGELCGVGTAVQPGYAMMELDSGIAVKIKHHI